MLQNLQTIATKQKRIFILFLKKCYYVVLTLPGPFPCSVLILSKKKTTKLTLINVLLVQLIPIQILHSKSLPFYYLCIDRGKYNDFYQNLCDFLLKNSAISTHLTLDFTHNWLILELLQWYDTIRHTFLFTIIFILHISFPGYLQVKISWII